MHISDVDKKKRLITIIMTLLFCQLLTASCLKGREINLAQIQKEEASRRKKTAASRISLCDTNLEMIKIEGVTGFCSQLFTTMPLPDFSQYLFRESGQNFRQDREKQRQNLIDEIREAEANIEYFEKEKRTLDQQLFPYPIPDKEGFIRDKETEFQQRIDGERYFIYLTKQKLRK